MYGELSKDKPQRNVELFYLVLCSCLDSTVILFALNGEYLLPMQRKGEDRIDIDPLKTECISQFQDKNMNSNTYIIESP